MKLELDGSKDQFLYRASFARSFAFEPTIKGIRNVDSSSHNSMLPYLWLIVKDSRLPRKETAGGMGLRLHWRNSEFFIVPNWPRPESSPAAG
jgi:hypothetical protein